MKNGIKNFIDQIRARRVRKTMAIYISSALTTIGIMKLFTEVYALPNTVFQIVVVCLTWGVISAFVFAWYHGQEGSQRMRVKEYVVHGLVVVLCIFTSFRVPGHRGVPILPADAKSLAVLPFKNMSDNKDDEYFSDGVMEDILTQLCKIGDLKVISRTSVMKYKNTQKTIREIGEELGVASILEGSVRRSGNRVRIVGQLINARNDEHIWAETYDREVKDIFAIQGEVARTIATTLQAKLSPKEISQLEKKATENIDAYTLYLKGRDFYNHYKKDDNEKAIDLFKQALALDPLFALAYAGLGDAYGQRVERFHFGLVWLDSALAMSDRALEINPNIAEPYKSRGVVYFRRGQFQRALAEYHKAAEINPNYGPALANLGSIYWYTGRYDEALKWMKRSVAVNPTRASGYHSIGLVYHGLLDDSAAERWFSAALRLQPDFTPSEAYRVKMCLTQGRIEAAKAGTDSLVRKFPGDRLIMQAAGDVHLVSGEWTQASAYYDSGGVNTEKAFILWKSGHRKEAGKIIDGNIAENLAQVETGTEEFTPYYELSRLYAIRGEKESALRWLGKAIEAGWLYVRWTRVDPLLENIRESEEFRRLMDEVLLRVEAMRKRAEEEVG
jgi:protein kinase/serine/threonine-protein kinase